VAFGVQDFQDLVRLLEQHPEWRAELRRLLLPEELLGLPAAVRELADEVRALARTVAELAEAQGRTEGRLDRLEQVLVELAEIQRRTDGRLDRLEQHVAELRGSDLERRYREHAGGYFDRLLRRVRVVRPEELDALLEEAVAAGALDEDGAHDVRLADLVVRGRRPGEEGQTYLVVEVSAGIGGGDVERAARRASLLGRVHPALAAVAGEWLTPEAAALVRARGVWQVLDGRVRARDAP
jgi:hypothetical protein